MQNKPTTTNANTDPSGRVETGTSGSPTVRHVSVTPATLTLNAPDADGNAPAGFATAASVSADVVLSNGQPDPKGVTWSVSDARLRLDADGTLRVLPGAAAGAAVIKAVAVGDASRTASLPITITDNGQLRLRFSPALPLFSSDTYRVTVTRGGVSVHQGNYKGTTRLTLAAGSNYAVLVERIADLTTTTSDSVSGVSVGPNGLTTLDFTLE
ncbi:hypothetical protein D3C86_1080040 [compost metagenome]